MSEKLTPEDFLKKLSANLEHDREDIADIIDDYLNKDVDRIDDKSDSRYISGKIPGENEISVEYDTFTGSLSYRKIGEEWKDVEDYQLRADEVI